MLICVAIMPVCYVYNSLFLRSIHQWHYISIVNQRIKITVSEEGFTVRNQGDASLDKERVFHRFYLPGGRREGSTGLGLALAYSVCERCGLSLKYDFKENIHIFSVILKK